jgi:hypothetical protein
VGPSANAWPDALVKPRHITPQINTRRIGFLPLQH